MKHFKSQLSSKICQRVKKQQQSEVSDLSLRPSVDHPSVKISNKSQELKLFHF